MVYCKECGKELSPDAEYCTACGTPTRNSELILASWGERFVAFLIDSILVGAVVGIFVWPRHWTSIDVPFLDLGINNMFLFLYWAYLEGTTGQSLGKKVMKIKVVEVNGHPIDVSKSIYQAIGKAFLIPIDVILGWIMYPDNQQRLFNHLSDTIVVKE